MRYFLPAKAVVKNRIKASADLLIFWDTLQLFWIVQIVYKIFTQLKEISYFMWNNSTTTAIWYACNTFLFNIKNEDDLTNEYDLKTKTTLNMEDRIKSKNDLGNEDNLKMKTT